MNPNFILFSIFVFIKTIGSDNSGLPGRIPILMAASMPDQLYSGRASFNLNEPIWDCEFQQDFCNFKNSFHMAQFQRHSDPRSPWFGQPYMLYINVTDAAEYPAARLETNYFITSSQYACLSLKYLMYGTGALKLFVIQQDIENKCIWADHNDIVDINGQWRDTQMTINMRDGIPRFFIEAHIDGRPPNYGTIAINKLSISNGVCSNDSTNNCQRRDNQPIPPVPSAVK